jgi:hypothetical protein
MDAIIVNRIVTVPVEVTVPDSFFCVVAKT